MTIEECLAGINKDMKISKSDVWKHQTRTNKPLSSFGTLEQMGYRLTSILGLDQKNIQGQVVVFAADHGIAEMNLSVFDQSQTKKVVSLLLKGKTPLNKITDQFDSKLICVDIGINGEINEDGILRRKVENGTGNIFLSDAMDEIHMRRAIETGIEVASLCAEAGIHITALGEVGIGNTIASSAITAVLCGLSCEKVTGSGTGVMGQTLERKKEIIGKIIADCTKYRDAPYSLLMKTGGYEICGDIGFILGCAYYKIPVILDGFITGAAALVASQIHHDVVAYLFASHQSAEPAHTYILDELNLKPLLNLGMKYGLATGAAMALPLYITAYKLTNNIG